MTLRNRQRQRQTSFGGTPPACPPALAFAYDFIISRRGSVAAVAREVADILEADGYRVTVQDYDFAASGQFVRDIDHATRQPRFLLVYDNAPNPAALAGLPPSRGARMLITSRHPDRAAQAREFLTLCPTPPLWGHEPGRRPHYSLRTVKAAFADAARINRTMTAAVGADELGLDEHAVLDVIAGLTARDFDKSMPSEVNPTVWQDVYKPVIGGRELYVNFTLDARGNLLLISFKENAS